MRQNKNLERGRGSKNCDHALVKVLTYYLALHGFAAQGFAAQGFGLHGFFLAPHGFAPHGFALQGFGLHGFILAFAAHGFFACFIAIAGTVAPTMPVTAAAAESVSRDFVNLLIGDILQITGLNLTPHRAAPSRLHRLNTRAITSLNSAKKQIR